MKILVYENCGFIQKALQLMLADHDLTVVNEIVIHEGSETLFAIDAFSGKEIVIAPTQFELAFVDRQTDKSGETLQLVTALSSAGLPCIGTSVIPASNKKIGTLAKGTISKVVLIYALRSGFATPRDFVNYDSDLAARLDQFGDRAIHPTSEDMVKLHQETEDFLHLLAKAE
jgi:hypothetical protein